MYVYILIIIVNCLICINKCTLIYLKKKVHTYRQTHTPSVMVIVMEGGKEKEKDTSQKRRN